MRQRGMSNTSTSYRIDSYGPGYAIEEFWAKSNNFDPAIESLVEHRFACALPRAWKVINSPPQKIESHLHRFEERIVLEMGIVFMGNATPRQATA
jgi:hypothetical protein